MCGLACWAICLPWLKENTTNGLHGASPLYMYTPPDSVTCLFTARPQIQSSRVCVCVCVCGGGGEVFGDEL
jgi:hypothetical protein